MEKCALWMWWLGCSCLLRDTHSIVKALIMNRAQPSSVTASWQLSHPVTWIQLVTIEWWLSWVGITGSECACLPRDFQSTGSTQSVYKYMGISQGRKMGVKWHVLAVVDNVVKQARLNRSLALALGSFHPQPLYHNVSTITTITITIAINGHPINHFALPLSMSTFNSERSNGALTCTIAYTSS